MIINAIEELSRTLSEIDDKIKDLENSPNRVFVLIEYDTLSSFHYFNLCFKQFWDEFDRHSSFQLLQYQKFTKKFLELRDRYVSLFREQITYLESMIDFKDECVKELPPVLLSEDYKTDVIGYYKECLKDVTDDDGKPLFEIELDKKTCYESINGKDVPIDFYLFCSKNINNGHYKSLIGMYNCLNKIFNLMSTVCSYLDDFLYNYNPSKEEIVCALDKELKQYAKEIGKNVERELKKIAQGLKTSRNTSLNPDVWGRVMQQEDDLFDLAISDKLVENTEKRFENIFEEDRIQLTENHSLLQKILRSTIDGELFDINLSVETHQLLLSLNADNLDLFFNLVLRRNIIQREMFPEELGTAYEEWLNSSDEHQSETDEEIPMNPARQSKLNEIIRVLQNGNWKEPATTLKIEHFLNTILGKDTSSLEETDANNCEMMWKLVESGGGDRMVVLPANLAGFFSEENLLKGSPSEISSDLFGNKDQVNNVNKGKSNYCSKSFEAVIPFLKKYTNKIIREI